MKKHNPIIPMKGVCDPHIHIFNGKAYLYASHDDSIDNKSWFMSDWQIWSSDDLMNWKYESTIYPEDTYIGKSNECWAVDAAEHNGKFYYYFSNRNIDTGVAVSDNPCTNFRDALGKPLLSSELTPSLQYDPTVFVDDDKTPYLIWGLPNGNGYYISRLNDDMISLAEEPRRILIDGGAARDDKNFLHKKNGRYYLSWGSKYAISDNVYGPYSYIDNLAISQDHGSFFSWNGQDFYAFTIFDPTKYYRSTGICYVYYSEDGKMHADPMVAEYGVGIYDSQWSKINAIWYMKSKNVSKAENVWGDFDVCINNRSELYYPNIQNTSGKTKLYFELASVNDEVSYIEIFDGEKQIGSCEIMKTSGYHHCGYEVFRCDVEVPDKENINLTLKFKGNGGELMRLHWFRFV
jgi:arabinoxylan arabinofuranohydrolase